MTDRCRAWREAIQIRLDADEAAGSTPDLDSHLAVCTGCRGFLEDLLSIREGLRALPESPLPEGALEEVLGRTVRAGKERRPAAAWIAWAASAAAATIVLALIWGRPEAPTNPVPAGEDLARARREARIAISLVAHAFKESERIARDRVLAAGVAPALRRVPVRWSAFAESRKP